MRAEAEALIRRERLVAILRDVPPRHLLPLAEALVKGGVRALELTLSHGEPLEGIRQLRRELPPEVQVGAGTVLSAAQAGAALDAGAQFLLAPDLNPEVAEFARSGDVLLIPGVFTPTEVAQARRLGCSLLKLFPAATGGPGHLEALLGPFPGAELLVVGGVGEGNLGDFLRAGAAGAGVGGSLTRLRWDAPDFASVTRKAERLRAVISGGG